PRAMPSFRANELTLSRTDRSVTGRRRNRKTTKRQRVTQVRPPTSATPHPQMTTTHNSGSESDKLSVADRTESDVLGAENCHLEAPAIRLGTSSGCCVPETAGLISATGSPALCR